MGQMECYEKDFEEFMLRDTAEYYRRKAAVWIQVRAPPLLHHPSCPLRLPCPCCTPRPCCL